MFSPPRIVAGADIFEEFCEAVHLQSATAVGLLDNNGVINEVLCHDAACDVSVDLDHVNNAAVLMCSYVRRGGRSAFDRSQRWCPLVYGCDGHIFTNIKTNRSNLVEIYQEEWMRRDSLACIGVRGDKGQIAKLLRKPVLIFDDKELNIDLVRGHATREVHMDGFLVRMGANARRFVPPGFETANDPYDWPLLLAEFANAQSSGDPNAIPQPSGFGLNLNHVIEQRLIWDTPPGPRVSCQIAERDY